jgi:Transglycosylase-like domain
LNEGKTRLAAETEKRDGELSFRERARVVVVGVLASAALTGVLFATVAQGGSGGVGPGGGDGDRASASKYERIWDDFKAKDRKWARKTSACESGGNRSIHGGGGAYHGAFQFMKSTWKSAPKSVGADPHKQSWKTQAVVAVLLKKRDGAGHWPVCG